MAPGPKASNGTLKLMQKSASAGAIINLQDLDMNRPTSPGAKKRPASPGTLVKRLKHVANVVKQSRRQSKMANSIHEQQKAEDLRVGQLWNAELLHTANRENSEVRQRFWEDMKGRIVRNYGSVTDAFRKIDSSGDGSINFLEFAEMLRVIHLPLENRVARAMFDSVAGEDRELSLEELRTLLMQKTILKLQSTMRSFHKRQDRVSGHMQSFVKYLCNADEETLMKAVDRLQRKLTMPLCRDLWGMLRDHLGKVHSDGDLGRADFFQVLQSAIGSRLMVYEVMFLMRIFDKIDGHRRGSIHIQDLMTTLVLLSEDDREAKLHLLFEVFDTDFDDCLIFDQIRAMFQCICKHRPIVEESPTSALAARHELGLAFQEELAMQDGLKLYESLLWYFQRTLKLDSDVVTWSEMWRAFEQQPHVANATLPGLFRIHWVLKPSYREDPGWVDTSPHVHAHESTSPHKSRHRSTFAAVTMDHRPASAPGHENGSNHGHGSEDVRRATMATAPGTLSRCSTAPGTLSRGSLLGDSRASSKNLDSRASSKSVLFRQHSKRPESSHGSHHPAQSSSGYAGARERTAAFKQDVTGRFVSSLKNLADIRYAELTEGFRPVAEQIAEKEQQANKEADNGAQAIAGSTASLPPAARPSSAAGARRPINKLSRPGSSPGGIRRPPVAPVVGGMPRINSAPAQTFKAAFDEIPRPEAIRSMKWGLDAKNRFELYSTVKSGKNSTRHCKGCAGTDGLGYKCQLCQSQHVMVTNF